MSNPLALVIEDDQDQADIFAYALEMAEFETETIPDGRAALERLAQVVPDLVVLDLHLPYVSGDEILQYIRADARLADTKVLLATANPQMADVLQDQSDLVLLKPISFVQLRDLAKRLRPAE